jgi:hypothetical protein
MNLPRTVSYTSTIEKLRNDLHRDVVQTASLKDIDFEGFYEFNNPIEMVYTYYTNDREMKGRTVKIIGIVWDGNIISEDMDGNDVNLRYRDISIENLDMMLVYLRQEDYKKSGLTLSI